MKYIEPHKNIETHEKNIEIKARKIYSEVMKKH
jgi:hypothetical protein